jgi:lipid II:glycine glycyltransferase (peptidoglycan interpeptide bridge formation enzyme)
MKKRFNAYRPSNLLQWNIIKWANNSGYTQYNMVWAPLPGYPEYSITRFKLGFGGCLKEVHIYFKKQSNPRYFFYKINNIFDFFMKFNLRCMKVISKPLDSDIFIKEYKSNYCT